MGYEMFRSLAECDHETAKIKECLIRPGPDLIVCDEAHLLKNDKTSLSVLLSDIQTMRRIALTGTPLQNNLLEYYCMVHFIKPYLLGTMKEYCNRFVNPIQNGQYMDSTRQDIDLMNRRSFILHDLLNACVQRAGLSVLKNLLKEKEEYVIYIRLTKLQIILYKV